MVSESGTGQRTEIGEAEWVAFRGGELEGKRPSVLCAACRAKAAAVGSRQRAAGQKGTLCFQCYRAGLERERGIRAAAELDTASIARFQGALPFEPVNRARLERLRSDRHAARAALRAGAGRHVEQRRRAQITARHVLEQIALGVRAHESFGSKRAVLADATIRALELQLPASWLPFVVSR